MDCSPPGFSVCGISRQEYWSGQSFPSPGDLPNPGIKLQSPALQVDSLVIQVVKNLPVNVGDTREGGPIPGSVRFPGEGNGNPLQYSCLRSPMDRGAWSATVHGVTKIRNDWVTERVPTFDGRKSTFILQRGREWIVGAIFGKNSAWNHCVLNEFEKRGLVFSFFYVAGISFRAHLLSSVFSPSYPSIVHLLHGNQKASLCLSPLWFNSALGTGNWFISPGISLVYCSPFLVSQWHGLVWNQLELSIFKKVFSTCYSTG